MEDVQDSEVDRSTKSERRGHSHRNRVGFHCHCRRRKRLNYHAAHLISNSAYTHKALLGAWVGGRGHLLLYTIVRGRGRLCVPYLAVIAPIARDQVCVCWAGDACRHPISFLEGSAVCISGIPLPRFCFRHYCGKHGGGRPATKEMERCAASAE